MKTDIALDWNFFLDNVLQVYHMLDQVDRMSVKGGPVACLEHDLVHMVEDAQRGRMNCSYKDYRETRQLADLRVVMTHQIQTLESEKIKARFKKKYGSDEFIRIDESITQAYCNGYEDGIRDKPKKVASKA